MCYWIPLEYRWLVFESTSFISGLFFSHFFHIFYRLMPSPSTRDVHTSYDTTEGIDQPELHFHDKPLRNPPQIRQGVTLPLNLWTSDFCRTNGSVRPSHAPVHPSQSVPAAGTYGHLFAALEKKLQQVRIEVDTVMSALQTATTYVEQVEKERNGYKVLAYSNGIRYCRMKEERDRLRETGGTSCPEARSEPPPYRSPPVRDDECRPSSVGPSRRGSTLKARRQSLESHPLRNRRRSESADSSLSSEGESASFAVTSVAPSLPAQTIYRRNRHCDVPYIRDASRPEQSPRLAPLPYGRDEIGIHHIDLMYEPSVAGRISCRACRRKEGDSTELTNFPNDAAWEELRQHYMTEHPRACQEIARLTPDELDELRRYGIVPKSGRR